MLINNNWCNSFSSYSRNIYISPRSIVLEIDFNFNFLPVVFRKTHRGLMDMIILNVNRHDKFKFKYKSLIQLINHNNFIKYRVKISKLLVKTVNNKNS